MNGQVASSRLVLTGGLEKTPPPGPSLHPSPTPMPDVGALGPALSAFWNMGSTNLVFLNLSVIPIGFGSP